MDLTLWIEAYCHSVQRRKKPETQVVKKKERKHEKKPQQNEYKKINKINIMYKINYSLFLSSFILARKTKRKKIPTIVKHRAQI